MSVILASELAEELEQVMDRVVADHDPIHVAREKGKGNVVIVSEEDYKSLEETAYLFRSPANARRLLLSMAAAEAGEARERALIEPNRPA